MSLYSPCPTGKNSKGPGSDPPLSPAPVRGLLRHSFLCARRPIPTRCGPSPAPDSSRTQRLRRSCPPAWLALAQRRWLVWNIVPPWPALAWHREHSTSSSEAGSDPSARELTHHSVTALSLFLQLPASFACFRPARMRKSTRRTRATCNGSPDISG